MDAIVRHDQDATALTQPTLFARATGALPSAIAIVRVTGPQAASAIVRLTRRRLPPPRRAVVRALRDPASAALLDTALVLWLPGPATATGEDVAELHLHGSVAVVAAVERALAQLPGCTAAERGAFTRRAFENGRIDLSQVEGLADLLAARTERQRTAALVVAEGGLRAAVEHWQDRLLVLSARAEAAIDMAEEADVAGAVDGFTCDLGAVAVELRDALAAPPAERLRDGVRVVLAGPPNVGKSSLLNALAGREAALTAAQAGTTRDLIEVPLDIDGVPVVLIDTAGLRADTQDPVEAMGIARSHAALARADLVLWLGSDADAATAKTIRVAPKADLGDRGVDGFAVSAVTGLGVPALRAEIAHRARELLPAVGQLYLSAAQVASVRIAAQAVERAATLDDEVLRAEELRSALRALDTITGRGNVEAMLDTLFSRFCVGK